MTLTDQVTGTGLQELVLSGIRSIYKGEKNEN